MHNELFRKHITQSNKLMTIVHNDICIKIEKEEEEFILNDSKNIFFECCASKKCWIEALRDDLVPAYHATSIVQSQ